MKVQFKRCLVVSTERWKVKSLAKEVYLGRLGVEGNYIWCLVKVVIFMGLGAAKR